MGRSRRWAVRAVRAVGPFALLRRSREVMQPSVITGKLILDTRSGEFTCGRSRFVLRRTEKLLLSLLIERSGRVVSRSTIETTLRGETSPNAIEQVVSRLRKALSEQSADTKIRTIRGLGYMLEAGDVVES